MRTIGSGKKCIRLRRAATYVSCIVVFDDNGISNVRRKGRQNRLSTLASSATSRRFREILRYSVSPMVIVLLEF